MFVQGCSVGMCGMEEDERGGGWEEEKLDRAEPQRRCDLRRGFPLTRKPIFGNSRS